MSSTVLPLAGVILGSATTLIGQYLALRGGARREAAQRAGEQRAERKEAIIGFLSAAERIEQQRVQFTGEDASAAEQLIEQMHALWLAKKVVELVCSAEVAQAAHDYTRELNAGSKKIRQNAGNGGLSAQERELRAAFLEAARQELGYTGEPLQRRAYVDRVQGDTRMSPAQ